MNHLLQFVRSHDCAIDARIQDGAIWATGYWSQYDNAGKKLGDFNEWQRVGSTMAECRLWLGY